MLNKNYKNVSKLKIKLTRVVLVDWNADQGGLGDMWDLGEAQMSDAPFPSAPDSHSPALGHSAEGLDLEPLTAVVCGKVQVPSVSWLGSETRELKINI